MHFPFTKNSAFHLTKSYVIHLEKYLVKSYDIPSGFHSCILMMRRN
jgi:hypothetical protein